MKEHITVIDEVGPQPIKGDEDWIEEELTRIFQEINKRRRRLF